jgi:hypothetical protein
METFLIVMGVIFTGLIVTGVVFANGALLVHVYKQIRSEWI